MEQKSPPKSSPKNTARNILSEFPSSLSIATTATNSSLANSYTPTTKTTTETTGTSGTSSSSSKDSKNDTKRKKKRRKRRSKTTSKDTKDSVKKEEKVETKKAESPLKEEKKVEKSPPKESKKAESPLKDKKKEEKSSPKETKKVKSPTKKAKKVEKSPQKDSKKAESPLKENTKKDEKLSSKTTKKMKNKRNRKKQPVSDKSEKAKDDQNRDQNFTPPSLSSKRSRQTRISQGSQRSKGSVRREEGEGGPIGKRRPLLMTKLHRFIRIWLYLNGVSITIVSILMYCLDIQIFEGKPEDSNSVPPKTTTASDKPHPNMAAAMTCLIINNLCLVFLFMFTCDHRNRSLILMILNLMLTFIVRLASLPSFWLLLNIPNFLGIFLALVYIDLSQNNRSTISRLREKSLSSKRKQNKSRQSTGLTETDDDLSLKSGNSRRIAKSSPTTTPLTPLTDTSVNTKIVTKHRERKVKVG